MPRGLWTGSLSFGLVNVPVQLISAVRDVDLHFHQLHRADNAPIETRRFCSEEDREVPYEEIGHGYELEDGNQVVLTDDDLGSVAPRKTRTIDIEAFVDLADVDPVLFDHPYFLVPASESEGARRAYQLLVEALGSTDRAALGRFVLRSKEYLALVRVRDERLALTTMLFHDEIRSHEGIDHGGRKPSKQQLEGAMALIEALSVAWDPASYEDRYRRRLSKVIDQKRRGHVVEAPRQDKQPAAVPDLMAALQRSLDDARRKQPSADGDAGDPLERRDLQEMTRDELYERAREHDIPKRSSMNKQQLINALAG